MNNYVRVSLETHMFFARIMKEHAFFLQVGFAKKDTEWIRKADYFRKKYEELLSQTVHMSNRMVSSHVLNSGEMVTKYTMDAERKTSELSGIPIDKKTTAAQLNMECVCDYKADHDDVQVIHRLNEKALWLLNDFIDFKEKVLCEVKQCHIFTTNYPLFNEHIIEEAKFYRNIVKDLQQNHMHNKEEFWNGIMMEHALFIRGLLDPCEGALINTADEFAHDFDHLLEMTQKKDCCVDNEMTLKKTCEIRDFKSVATEGILNCEIKSIISPLLADHVTREANYYIRIQKHYGCKKA